jgi:hypothetical protein
MLYHDISNKYAFWLCDRAIDSKMTDALDIISHSWSKDYCKRLTYSPNELREKILIYDSGLNDLFVHMCKIGISSKNDIPTDSLLFTQISRRNNHIGISFYRSSEEDYVTLSDINDPFGLSNSWGRIEQYLDWIHVDDNNYYQLYKMYGHLI